MPKQKRAHTDAHPADQRPKSKNIGIIALKGGVGKTSCTANLGGSLATEFQKKVLLVDANFSVPNLGFHLGVFEPKITIHDVIQGKRQVREAVHEVTENLHLIPGAVMGSPVDAFKLKNKLAEIKQYYDYVLIDSSPNLNKEILATMVAADELYVVTSPDYPTLSTTLRAVKLALERKTPINGLILNMVRNKKFELSMEEIEEAAGIPIVGVLPADVKVIESVAATDPLTNYRPKTNTSIEFHKLAAFISGESYNDPRFWKRITALFTKEVPKEEVNKLLVESVEHQGQKEKEKN